MGGTQASIVVSATVPDVQRLTGMLVLIGEGTRNISNRYADFYTNDAQEGCAGLGGYSDIAVGMQVRIADNAGQLIGVSSLSTSEFVTAEKLDGLGTVTAACVFRFAVEIPGDRNFYTVELGRRGSLAYSRADLISSGWHIELRL
jgi:hypothetical protein